MSNSVQADLMVSERKSKTLYVLRETFEREVCKGMDAKAVAKALRDAGALKPDGDGCTTRKEALPGMPPQRCCVILPKFWEL